METSGYAAHYAVFGFYMVQLGRRDCVRYKVRSVEIDSKFRAILASLGKTELVEPHLLISEILLAIQAPVDTPFRPNEFPSDSPQV